MRRLLVYDTTKDTLKQLNEDLQRLNGEVVSFKNYNLIGQLQVEVIA